MARTNIAAQATPGAYPSLPISPGARALSFTGSDVPNGNDTALVDSKTLVLVRNTDSGAHTVTFTSVADTLNRKGDITAYSVPAGAQALFGPFKLVGWSVAGRLQIDGSDVTLQIAVVTLP